MASPTTAQRVWPRWSGPVGFAEMNSTSIFSPCSVSVWPYAAPAATIGRDDPLRPCRHGDVEELGPAISTPATPRPRPAAAAPGRRGRAAHPRPLAQLQGDIGRVVAVTLLPRTLHRHVRRDTVREGHRTLGGQRRRDVDDRGGELLGSHRARVSAGGRRPASISGPRRTGGGSGWGRPIARARPVRCRVTRSRAAPRRRPSLRSSGIEHWFPAQVPQVRILPEALHPPGHPRGSPRGSPDHADPDPQPR